MTDKLPYPFLMPAKALVGKSVKRPKGSKRYSCTSKPTEPNLSHEAVTANEFYFSDVVYINSGGYSTAWAAYKPLKCELSREEIIKIKEEFNLGGDYELTYLKGPSQVTVTLDYILN